MFATDQELEIPATRAEFFADHRSSPRLGSLSLFPVRKPPHHPVHHYQTSGTPHTYHVHRIGQKDGTFPNAPRGPRIAIPEHNKRAIRFLRPNVRRAAATAAASGAAECAQ
jgi:hypothetical protein